MFAMGIPAALAMAVMQSAALAVVSSALIAPPRVNDSETLAAALAGPTLELTMRGTGVAVQAETWSAEDGCAALIAVQPPGAARQWTRMFRWSDVAWTGALPDGRTLVAFFEQEGRLPGDRLAFAPVDPVAFVAALSRVKDQCRAARDEADRVASGEYAGTRSCYFARMPGLELVEATTAEAAPEPTRAVVTLLAHETPEAELRLLFERAALSAGGEGWRPEVAFTIAAPELKAMGITGARFALDGTTVPARHTLAMYGDTRLRIRMDPSLRGAPTSGDDSFYPRLAASGRASLTLFDSAGAEQAVLNFDAGPALAAARRALEKADWSCASAAPTLAPAAEWRLAAGQGSHPEHAKRGALGNGRFESGAES